MHVILFLMKLILLAAGKSSRIYRKLGKHKCLLKIKNKTLIEKIINGARSCGLKKIDIIVGFKKENIMSYFKNSKIKFIYNKYYNTHEMLYSFILGLKGSNEDLIISPAGTGAVILSGVRVSGTEISTDDSTQVTVRDGLTVTGAVVMMRSLPTSDPSNAGQLWNSSGDLKISAG